MSPAGQKSWVTSVFHYCVGFRRPGRVGLRHQGRHREPEHSDVRPRYCVTGGRVRHRRDVKQPLVGLDLVSGVLRESGWTSPCRPVPYPLWSLPWSRGVHGLWGTRGGGPGPRGACEPCATTCARGSTSGRPSTRTREPLWCPKDPSFRHSQFPLLEGPGRTGTPGRRPPVRGEIGEAPNPSTTPPSSQDRGLSPGVGGGEEV